MRVFLSTDDDEFKGKLLFIDGERWRWSDKKWHSRDGESVLNGIDAEEYTELTFKFYKQQCTLSTRKANPVK